MAEYGFKYMNFLQLLDIKTSTPAMLEIAWQAIFLVSS